MLSILCCLSLKFIGLDIGSQFYKIAESTSTNEVKIWTNPETNSVSNPTASALKFAVPHTAPYATSDYEDITFRMGRSALSTLKYNKTLGFEFTPRALGRAKESTFYTSKVANSTEMFTLMLYNAIKKVVPFEAVAISVPSFWTRDQVAEVSEACRSFQMPLVAMIDDVTAVTTLYAALRLGRFTKKDRHVMFIDVGATSVKIYSAVFTHNNTEPTREFAFVNTTTNEWTEEVGGFYFARAIAYGKNITFRKANKLLLRTGGKGQEEYLENVLEIFKTYLGRAVNASKRVAPLDEVQLIGGASSYEFVVKLIKEVTGMPIRRDFNANEAIAMGTVIAGMMVEEQSPYIETYVKKLSASSINVLCGTEMKAYCVQGQMCNEEVLFPSIERPCNEFALINNLRTLPEGANPILVKYSLKNPPTFTGEGNLTAKFIMRRPDPVVTGVEFCQGDDCQTSEVQLSSPPPDGYMEALDFIRNYLNSRDNQGLRDSIRETLEKLVAYQQKVDKANVEATYPVTDDMKTIIAEANEAKELDDFKSLDHDALKAMNDKLVKIVADLHLSQ